jgi:hypothetical protein
MKIKLKRNNSSLVDRIRRITVALLAGAALAWVGLPLFPPQSGWL